MKMNISNLTWRQSVRCTCFVSCFLFLVHFSAEANNIQLKGRMEVTEVNNGVATLEFKMSWENSWRDSYNWDAGWVILKYRRADDARKLWNPVKLQKEGNTVSGDFTCRVDMAGVLVHRSVRGNGTSEVTCSFQWPLPAGLTGMTKKDFDENKVFFLVQGVEMVYIPHGSYYLGDNQSKNTFKRGGKRIGSTENSAYLVEGEGKIAMGDDSTQLCADDGATWTGELPAAYPKGYKGFYVMKYEVSQEQYVRFLNALTLVQQQSLIPGLTALNKGEFIFGDKATPTNRNGIIVSVPSDGTLPAVFDHNLNKNDKYGEDGDGKCLACNFMNINDMLAYCAWAGLRPMSELEYEKSCRRPYPDLPVKGEFAWNTLDIVKVASVANGGTRSESTSAGNANYGSGLTDLGPVRCGLFATPSSTQALAGASFWGVMEMSGNLSELCVNVKHTAFAASTQGKGNFDLAVWGTTPAHFGLRGGGFTGEAAALAVSDRSAVTLADLTTRTNSVGFRGVFSPDTNGVKIDAGTITVDQSSACSGDPGSVSGTAATVDGGADLPFTYRWYMKTGSGNYRLLPGEMGADLICGDLINNDTSKLSYTFKRKALCALGEAESNEATVEVVNPDFRLSADTVVVSACGTGTAVSVLAAMTGVTPRVQWIYRGAVVDTGTYYHPSVAAFGDTNVSYRQIVCAAEMGGCVQHRVLVVHTPGTTAVSSDKMTMADCGQVALDERDGQHYCTVKIPGTGGRPDQCWFGKNMNIGTVVPGADYNTHTTAGIQKICYGDDEKNCDKYGGLYRWEEAVNGENNGAIKYVSGLAGAIQGICPDGWHVPSDAEWQTLEMNLGMASGTAAGQVGATGWRGTDQGTQMKMPGTFEGTNWCAGADCNKSGFNALPEGCRQPSGGGWGLLGSQNTWWSSALSGDETWSRLLSSTNVAVYRYAYAKSFGFGVRCIKNQEVAPTEVTMENCGQVLVKDEREMVPQYYNTVKISGAKGSQCWFSQNINIGAVVPGSDYNTHTTDGIQKICYGDDEKNCDKYGGLYNWDEAVNGEKAGAIKYVSGLSGLIQGICPDGWHVPSDAEFKTLEMNLGMTQVEADKTYAWRGTDQGTQMKMPGTFEGTDFCTGADCNKSGFNGLPGGCSTPSNGSFSSLGSGTYLWSSTVYDATTSWRRTLNYTESKVYRNNLAYSYGFSVRCVKNQEVASTEVTMENCGEVLVKDTREAVPQYYNTVKISGVKGSQCWFSQNMNIGTVVPGADYNTHTVAGIQKICYGDKEENCDKYGGLYNWDEAVNGEKSGAIKYVSGLSGLIQGICPDGWHVPSDAEFKNLEMNLGMTQVEADKTGSWRGTDQGTQMKMPGTFEGTDWCTGVGCNKSGFNGFPGGYRHFTNAGFYYLGTYAYLWSSTVYDATTSWRRTLNYTESKVYRNNLAYSYGFSVRCVKNQEVASTEVTMENCGEVLVKDTREAVPQYYNTVKISGVKGSQCWFSQNMNIGTVVPGSDYNTHTVAGIQKICYGDKEENCTKYGGLYNWDETVNGEKAGAIKYVSGLAGAIQGICPDGWHVPSDAEWQTLEMNLGMTQAEAGKTNAWRGTDQGTQMKMPGTFEGPDFCTGAGCNKSGFNGLPGGRRHPSNGSFGALGTYAYLWSSTVYDVTYSWNRNLDYSMVQAYRFSGYAHSHGFSVRCVRN